MQAARYATLRDMPKTGAAFPSPARRLRTA
jgi:hypothetical protein